MKVLKLNQLEQFSCVPRNYPISTDTLSIKLRNEITDLTIDLSFTFSVSGSYLTIILSSIPSDFKSGNKYAITIHNITQHDNVIYLGKLLIVDENTDIQNYEYQSQTASRFNY